MTPAYPEEAVYVDGAPGGPCVVALRAIDPKAGWPFWRQTAALGISRILVRDIRGLWFEGGITEEYNTLRRTALLIERLVRSFKPTWTAVVGASAGAYAAIAVGHIIGADTVLAFSPQVRLTDLEWICGTQVFATTTSEWEYDLTRLVHRHNGRTRYFVHTCRAHEHDPLQAALLSGIKGFKVVQHMGRTHRLAGRLENEGKLTPMIRRACRCRS
jgi:hypothetical protein